MAIDSFALTAVSSLFAHHREAKNVSKNEGAGRVGDTVKNGHEAALGVSQCAWEGGG